MNALPLPSRPRNDGHVEDVEARARRGDQAAARLAGLFVQVRKSPLLDLRQALVARYGCLEGAPAPAPYRIELSMGQVPQHRFKFTPGYQLRCVLS